MNENNIMQSNQEPINVFVCRHVGVAKTTETWFQTNADGIIEARCGIALLGFSNMSEEQLKQANPFDAGFNDNYASGMGTTKDVALANLDQDLNRLANWLHD
jgi:hypothetical protein